MRLALNDQYDTMPWDAIDAVVFDVGNVLVEYAPMEILRKRLPQHPELYEVLQKKIMGSPYWLMLDRGTITQEEAIRAMTGKDAKLEPYIRRVMGKRMELDTTLPEGMAALKACKAHGKKLYVLSNYPSSGFDYAAQKHPEFAWFEGLVVSSKVGMLKPDPEIYRYLTKKFSLEPSRTLFIDDSAVNIEGALNAGWQGLCYQKEGCLAKFFSLQQEPEKP